MPQILQVLSDVAGFFLAWYNLPFTFLLLACVLLGGLQLTGLGGEQEHDADGDLDHDVDMSHDIDQDIDHDLDHDVDHDVDAEHDLSHDADGAESDADDAGHEAVAPAPIGGAQPFSVLAYVGAGKAPLMIVLLILFAAIGIIGWFLNGLVVGTLGFYPGLALLVTLPAAVLAGTFLSGRTSRLIGQILPPLSTTATSHQGLIGRKAIVTSPWIDAKYGQVRLRDPGGTQINVFALTKAEPPIQRGEQVILTKWDGERRVYWVEK